MYFSVCTLNFNKKFKINPIYYILRSHLPDITKRKSVGESTVPKKKTLNSISTLLPTTFYPHKIQKCVHLEIAIKNQKPWTLLVVQWLRIHLPVQRTWV